MTELRDQLQGTLGAAYLLERELGGGGMSRVFVATETALGRTVVVKVLPPELVGGVNMDRFRREIRFAARLQHPHIVPVLMAGEMDGVPYYTMPFVEGQSLRDRLRDSGALPLGEALSILRDVAKALAYAHAHDVVHRDIKPDNVLLSGGVAVVTDFGIAKALSSSTTAASGRTSLTMTGVSVGTPAYMPPEQAAADPGTDHRADIYAFGCVAYELLTGQAPFADVPPHKRLTAQVTGSPLPIGQFRPDVPRPLDDLVMRCLQADPAARPQRADELTTVLEGVVSRRSAQLSVPTAMLVPAALGKALMVYVVAVLAVLLLARAAIVWIGLPDWVVTGAMIVMALGLPVVVLTAWVHYVTHRAASEAPAAAHDGRGSRRSMSALAVRASPHLSWGRTARGGLAALGVFVLLVAGYMTMRALGIGPAASLLAAGRLNERDRLLVGDFRINGGDTSLARVVTEAVRTGLSESPTFTTMSPTAIAGALRRMQRPTTSWVDLSLAREIAQREGAKAVVTGDVNPLGAGYVVTVRLVSADSGAELASFHETADGPRDLLPTIDALTRHLRSKAGESLRSVHADPPLEQVTTSSLDALRKYVDGARASDAAAYERAIADLKAAIALDTGFAMAYRKLSAVYFNAAYPRAMRDSALTNAYRFRDRLTERERGRLVGDYFTAGPGRDRGQGIAAYEALIRRYPDDQPGLNNLANALETRREFARAESLFARLTMLDTTVVIFHTNLLATLIEQEKLADAEHVARELRRRFPSPSAYGLQTAVLLYSRDEPDSAVALLRQLQQSRSPGDRVIAAYPLAGIALSRGHLRESMALRAERSALNAARGAPIPALEDSLAASFNDIWFREQPEQGIRRMEAALALMPIHSLASGQEPYYTVTPGYLGTTPYFTVATQYALANRPERARATLAEYDAAVRDSVLRRFLEPVRQNTLGEIALAERQPAEALRAFRRADQRNDGPTSTCRSCPMVRIARAFDLAGSSDSAIVYFERYLTLHGAFRLSPDNDGTYLAGIYKRLGELYEAKGNRARAAEYYRRFVAMWKDADPELQPKVAEVQRRLARIGAPDG